MYNSNVLRKHICYCIYALDTFWPGMLVILLMGIIVYIINIWKLKKKVTTKKNFDEQKN